MNASLRTTADLQHFIDAHAIQAELLRDIGHTPTVPAAALALGVTPDQIIKTLLFLIEQPGQDAATPVVVISHGDRRVDKGALAAHFGVAKKRVTLAPSEVVLSTLGYPAGGVPPFGHMTPLPVIVDASIQTLDARHGGVIFGGGGDDRTMMRLTVAELLRVTGAEVLAVSVATPSDS
ncbi:MAG TPA: EbsC protein [Chloroflexi bacterium]|nr:EbsC protein [Chloroflexota bacterium]HHW86257.1 YbaK/EbsC family protein [Chloroflexota bacterium]